jgi:glycosyltransferase involved in cell wall biosynthesis
MKDPLDDTKSKVTIAIPTLDRAEYLRLAIASALAQTYDNLEVLVSDNASTDHTSEVLTSLSHDQRLRTLHQPVRLTMVENWNACIAAATGNYFLLLSDDDLLEQEAIATMVKVYEDDLVLEDDIGMVYCRGRVIDEHGVLRHLGPSSPSMENTEHLILGFFNSQRAPYACTVLYRRNDILRGYEPEYPLMTDAAQWIQTAVNHGTAAYVDRVLASYRVHQNITAKTPVADWQKDNLAIAEYAITKLQGARSGSTAIYGQIRQAVNRLNVRIVPGLLNQRFAGRKRDAFRAYLTHWRDFASAYGARQALRGLLQLYVPAAVRSAAHKLYILTRGAR